MMTPTLSHRHSLDDLAGYRVRQTVRDGEHLTGKILVNVAFFYGPHLYAHALEVARPFRTATSWALVDRMYDCGCVEGDSAYPEGCPVVDLNVGLCETCADHGDIWSNTDPQWSAPCPDCVDGVKAER